MTHKFLKLTLLLCLSSGLIYAQKSPEKKRGMLSYSINLSDYSFVKIVQDSTIGAAFSRKGIFKSGNSSFGIGLSYWKGLGSHIDFSGNLSGTFSNFPAMFVKDDSVGQAGFTPQLDALLHIRALRDNKLINPFLTGGVGAGYFGKQFVAYAPVGVGLQLHFKSGAFVLVQAQWRMALTDGINNDYMFYSLGFAHQAPNKKTKKVETKEIPALDTAKVKPADEKMKELLKEKDTDADGVTDSKDGCPTVKGTINGCPDLDGDGIADKDDQCMDVKGVTRYNGCPVPDTDGDGVNDDDDECKTEKGVKENKGCPADSDGDGVTDKDDKCPDAAGTAENSGCPLPVIDGAKLLRSSPDSMTYYVRFDFDQAIITAEAFAILKQIVQVLKADKTLNINIDGHADKFGLEKYNVAISADRANVVRDYFMSYNIAKSRMKVAYYGSSRPYDIHQEWLDRRVEITIYKKK